MMAHPAPRHLYEQCPYPGRTITANLLIVLHIREHQRHEATWRPVKLRTNGHPPASSAIKNFASIAFG